MAANGQPQVSTTMPPRTLNVQKFAESRTSELEALHSIVSKQLNNDFRSQRNKRRRTTGYDNRVAKRKYRSRQKVGGMDVNEEGNNLQKESKKKMPRYVCRKIELGKNPETGFCTSGDGTKRMRTHIWHAKRFTMTKLWGFHLPLGLHGRGRGSRSIMKFLKERVIVHDASYAGAVQLEGPQEMLLSVLSMVLVPCPSAHSEEFFHRVVSGVTYGSAMLHHVGAPFSQTIAPVTYMWRPPHWQCGDCSVEDHNHDGSSALRQMWVWIHAAAFGEGYDALKSACQKKIDEVGALITCISLEGKLGNLEVMGSNALQLLQKILHPITSSPKNCWEIKKCSVVEANNEAQLKNSSVLENEDQNSPSVISLTVDDPRTFTGKDDVFIPRERSTGITGHVEDEVDEHTASTGIPESGIKLISSRCLENDDESVIYDSTNLWDVNKGIYPPVEESVLCMERRHRRLASYCLTEKGPREQCKSTSRRQSSRLCPILLLRNNSPKNSIMRWSIVLPLSWVKTFWITLVSSGGRAIGLREKHWIACEVGLPYFPSDFPGCNAYSCFMATEAAASVQNDQLRPPSMSPLSVPMPPPWDTVRYSFDKNAPAVGDNQISPKILSSENTINDCIGVLFEGLVPRTSFLLSQFLSGITDNHLLLFPYMPYRKNCISKFIKDKGIFSRHPNEAISTTNYERKLCFVRVLLHAYKEGVFEEGAVVCAPHLSDLILWTSRSDSDKVELQIPQALLRSYFVQQPSGKWDFQLPDDPVAKDSHRWPIGFVTTGFVYGSNKPVAGALCDAVLLARLREEQWNAVPAKRRRKEIFVLVRNLRSTAYRLALANIVLEQQEEDVEYM